MSAFFLDGSSALTPRRLSFFHGELRGLPATGSDPASSMKIASGVELHVPRVPSPPQGGVRVTRCFRL
jgi:hypothetical protein